MHMCPSINELKPEPGDSLVPDQRMVGLKFCRVPGESLCRTLTREALTTADPLIFEGLFGQVARLSRPLSETTVAIANVSPIADLFTEVVRKQP